MWFDRSVRIDYHDEQNQLEVAVPNQFVADWVDRHFKEELQQAAHDELNTSVGLQVRVDPNRFSNTGSVAPPAAERPVTSVSSAKDQGRGRGDRGRPVERPSSGELRYRLEDFIVGVSNELAYTAAHRVIEDDTAAMNPLFIHGGCGLGKTHLLQGLCRKMRLERPEYRVLYTTGEQFTNEFLTAMRSNRVDLFRRKIRKLDLLAVDDVHFLANKQATQQEFLHSFDAIELGGARVVLASDSHPSLIQQFTEALVSRCVRGMVVQMHQPDTATRVKIIQALAQRRGLLLMESAVESLTARYVGSVREIEGALTKLHALAFLESQRKPVGLGGTHRERTVPVGNTLVERLLKGELAPYGRKAVRFETILATVVDFLKIERARVVGTGRHPHVVMARALVIYLARKMTMMSYPEIAVAMSRRNHSTIITAAQRIEKQLTANPTVLMPATMEHVPLAELVEHLKRAVVRA